ncbi:hypothetical protein PGT21_023999 [Puccinia graminis f. sp. tritici]|uniref:Uncharacterized protein n=1 Tax=Puccinia graminis f. sp. tritici TaxID=56615 RepID=A0A5B0NR07_PUCGR|nr:hypothetical protein PGT21_023999 [Puccinia graminis f. sp. tritici]
MIAQLELPFFKFLHSGLMSTLINPPDLCRTSCQTLELEKLPKMIFNLIHLAQTVLLWHFPTSSSMAPPEYLGPDKSHFVDPMFDLTQNSYQENKTNMINRGEVKADEADLKFDRDYQEPLNPQYRFQSDSTKRQKLNNHDGVISYQPAGHPGTHPDSKICRATHDNGLLDFGCEILKEEQTVKDFHFISSLPEATTNTAQHTHVSHSPDVTISNGLLFSEENHILTSSEIFHLGSTETFDAGMCNSEKIRMSYIPNNSCNRKLGQNDTDWNKRLKEVELHLCSPARELKTRNDQSNIQSSSNLQCYPQIQAGERNESSFTMKDAPDLLRILGNTISNQHEKDNSKSPDHSPINNQEILSQEPVENSLSIFASKTDDAICGCHGTNGNFNDQNSDHHEELVKEKFKTKLSELFQVTHRNHSIEYYSKTGIPVQILQQYPPKSYSIRIMLKHQISNRSKQRTQRSQKLFHQFQELIKWLILINTSVVLNFDKPFSNHEEEYDSHNDIVMWLFNESFHPEGSYPICGNIADLTKLEKGEGFGPIQYILLDYLSKTISRSKPLNHAVEIIKIYYKYFKPIVWKWLGDLHSKGELDQSLKTIIYNAIKSSIKIPQETPSNILESSQEMGTSELLRSDVFPDMMRVKRYSRHLKYEFSKEVNTILESFTLFSLQKNQDPCYESIQAKNFPALLTKVKKDGENGLKGVSWIVLQKGKRPNKQLIFDKLYLLLFNLERFYLAFVEFLLSKNLAGNLEELHPRKFFEWVHDLLMTQKENLLPVFGNFKWKEDGLSLRGLDSSYFSEVQIFLINYFSYPISYKKTAPVALSLIGYWFKKNSHQNFIKVFQNNKSYWDTVIENLPEMETHPAIQIKKHLIYVLQ